MSNDKLPESVTETVNPTKAELRTALAAVIASRRRLEEGEPKEFDYEKLQALYAAEALFANALSNAYGSPTLTTNAEYARFINRLKILWSLDRHEIHCMSDRDWRTFSSDPPRYLMMADDYKVQAVLVALCKREVQQHLKSKA